MKQFYRILITGMGLFVTVQSVSVALYAGERVSPGATVGTTWWDEQDKQSSGQRVVLSTEGGRVLVHHGWTWAPDADLSVRHYRYRAYDVGAGGYMSEVSVQPTWWEIGGYVDVNVTGENRAVVSGHSREMAGPYRLWSWWDEGAGTGTFTYSDYPPDSLVHYAIPANRVLLWPRTAYVEGANDTVLHMIAQMDKQGSTPGAVYYVRRVGSEGSESAYWEYPPRVIDTAYSLGAYQMAATENGRVAVVWVANVPCAGDDDTVSGYGCSGNTEWDNDLYCQVSNDYGVTWEPRVNITKYSAGAGVSWRAHSEIGAIFDGSGELHVVWAAAAWPRTAPGAGEVAQTASVIGHWSESAPSVVTVHDADWNQTVCDGGSYALNVGDVSVAECRDRLYVLFVQFNDPEAGVMNDCASATYPSYPHGAANGELYVTVSDDGGVTWDGSRNITNTRTPGCDSAGGTGGACGSEVWASMTRTGSNVAIDPGVSGAEVVVPSGGTDPGWYLEVQYIEDRSPGAGALGEGYTQEGAVKWFRLACVDPVAQGCCVVRGDLNHNGVRNVADLTYMVNFLFKGGPQAPCYEEGDVNGNVVVNVADLTYFVNYLFKGGAAPVGC